MTDERRIGVGFIGCGMVADLHHSALDAVPGLELVGVFDIDARLRQARASAWGVQSYASLDDLLDDSRIEAVYVLTSTTAHVPVTVECLQRGRHVLIEKPVAPEAGEIDRLLAVANRSGKLLMAAHNYAYIPEFERIRRLVRAGKLGTIRSLWVNYLLRHPESIAQRYAGVLEEIMVHHSYLALALLGSPDRIHAATHPVAWEHHPVEDQAWMVWEWDGGASAFLFATLAADDESADPWTFIVKVVGTEGAASMSWRTAVSRNDETPWFAFGIPAYEDGYRHEARAFWEAIVHGIEPLSPLADAATSARLISAAHAAAAAHQVVERRGSEDGAARW